MIRSHHFLLVGCLLVLAALLLLSAFAQAQFGGFGSEPEQRFIGIEEGTRMRLEGERSGRLAERARPRQRRRDHRFVAAMHPVEIADGDGRAAERLGGRKIMHHLKVSYRHRRRLTTPVRALPHVARHRRRRTSH